MTASTFPQKTIYLAGPITGLTHDEARKGWRAEIANLLPPHIHCHSPMRGKDFLKNSGALVGDPNMYPEHAMARPSGIVGRDRNDVLNCDAMVACFLGAEKASVGSCIEYGWADAFRKPIILVIEPEGAISTQDSVEVYYDQRDMERKTRRINPRDIKNPHWHGMVTQLSPYIVHSLEEAAHIVTHLLTPGI